MRDFWKVVCIHVFMFLFFSINVMAEELKIYIDTPGSKTEFCIGDKTILTGKCAFGVTEFIKHEWKSSSEGIIVETKEQHAFVEFNRSGKHIINYNAWDEKKQKASAEITIIVHELPHIEEVTISQRFFTRLFGRNFPKLLEIKTIDTKNTYQWYLNNVIIDKAENNKIKVTENGRYRVIITSENGCKSYSEAIEIK